MKAIIKLLKNGELFIKNSSDHSQIFTKNCLLDFESAASISRSRFAVMKGEIAKLHRALINFMLTTHIEKYNYLEYNVPYIVNDECLLGTGQLPKFAADLFKIENENLYLIPTAEVPLTGIYKNKIILRFRFVFEISCSYPVF